MRVKKNKLKSHQEIKDYDRCDTTHMIDSSQQLRFENLGLKLPPSPPTQVISIRLPTILLNKLRALGSAQDVPYQALIKIFLTKAVSRS